MAEVIIQTGTITTSTYVKVATTFITFKRNNHG
jgi:hypothetical protein